ncbi:hypothetical protein ACFE04_025178 [Oxalis oulophora]
MGDTGVVRFPGNLDPRAQEFFPQTKIHFFPQPPPPPPPQVFYPFTPQPLYHHHPHNDVHVLPFCFPPPIIHHHHSSAAVMPPPSLPPPSLAAASGSTRTLVLTQVPYDVSESMIRHELEVFGEVRGVQMERVYDGIVTVHFYDLRHAECAHSEIREQRNYHESYGGPPPLPPNRMARGLIAGRAVWAHFIIPTNNAVPDGSNQGTIVVFNLNTDVSSYSLREIFAAFGDVKELRETPMKKRQRFIEFYDIRDAATALREMNGKEIFGRHVVIEFSRPGGYGRKFFNPNSDYYHNLPFIGSSDIHHSEIQTQPSSPSPPRKFISKGFTPHSQGYKSRNNSMEIISLDRLSLSGSGGTDSEEQRVSGNNTGVIKNGVKKYSSSGSNSGKSMKQHQQQQCRSNRSSKGRHMKKHDARFLINEEAMVESSCNTETRTTLMIKNIPNKYSQKLMLNMLDNHCIHVNEQNRIGDDQPLPLSSYDFLYLPIDFNNKCNVGYGFVNMTTPEAAWRLYKAFHNQHWEVFNSRKICEVTYARVQGLEALKEHFKNSKFPCEMDHYLPVVFSPPRDGKQQLTEPHPIVSQCNSINECDNENDNGGGETLNGGSSSSQYSSSSSSSSDGCYDHDEENGCGSIVID